MVSPLPPESLPSASPFLHGRSVFPHPMKLDLVTCFGQWNECSHNLCQIWLEVSKVLTCSTLDLCYQPWGALQVVTVSSPWVSEWDTQCRPELSLQPRAQQLLQADRIMSKKKVNVCCCKLLRFEAVCYLRRSWLIYKRRQKSLLTSWWCWSVCRNFANLLQYPKKAQEIHVFCGNHFLPRALL
jgi:hypothetical protein